jgi:hypothetical protein
LVPCTKVHEIDVAAFVVDPRAPEWAEFRDHLPRCADCALELARFATLTLALAGEATGASAHLSEAQIVALAVPSSQVARDERDRLEAHLAGCAPCRTELAVARGFDFAAISAPRRRIPRFGWRPALAAAAIVALAVPVGALIWRQARETDPISSPPTAKVERSVPTAPAVVEAPAQAEPEREPRPEPIQVVKQHPVVIPRPPSPSSSPSIRESPPEPPRPIQIAMLVPKESPIYAPGALANTAPVRIEGAARGSGAGASAPEALGPAHVGASAHESPTLYWLLPEATSSSVELTVMLPGAVTPVLETTFQGPLEAGVHRVSLAEHGVRLEPLLDYRWFVALVLDPERRSRDVVTGAGIR